MENKKNFHCSECGDPDKCFIPERGIFPPPEEPCEEHGRRHLPPERLTASDMKGMPLSLLIKIAQHRHEASVRRELEALGIPRGFGPLLREISKTPGLSQRELSEKVHFKASTISVSIQKMLDAELITRSADESDARQVRLSLTEKGEETCRRIEETFIFLEGEITKDLTEEEAQQLRRILIKLISK